MTAEVARLVIQKRTLRFSSPFAFNDPFDCRWDPASNLASEEFANRLVPAFRKLLLSDRSLPKSAFTPQAIAGIRGLRSRFARLSGAVREESFQREMAEVIIAFKEPHRQTVEERDTFLRRVRVLCMSEVLDSILMWSHYADRHRGVVIGFETSSLVNRFGGHVHKVNYEDKLPILASDDAWIEALMTGQRVKPSLPLQSLLLTKYSEWKYERERRFVFRLPDSEPCSACFLSPDFTDLQFPEMAIQSVCLGCECSSTSRESLMQALADAGLSPQVYEMKRSFKRFALELKRLDRPSD